MEDVSLINHQIKFHDGCRVDIWDHHSDTYLLEFYEREGNDWSLIQAFHTVPKFSYYHLMIKKFSIDWQVRISGWEDDQIKTLVVHTYSHYNKNILLIFDSDRYKDHLSWLNCAEDMVEKFNCSVAVVSRFKERLNREANVSILSEIPQNYEEEFYSSFIIGVNNTMSQFNEIFSVSYLPKSFNSPLTNGSNPYYSSNHKNNFIKMTPEELFKDIMNL